MSEPDTKKPDLKMTTKKKISWEDFSVPDASGTSPAESGLVGIALISDFVKHLPNSPGVYRMFNTKGDVLYVDFAGAAGMVSQGEGGLAASLGGARCGWGAREHI